MGSFLPRRLACASGRRWTPGTARRRTTRPSAWEGSAAKPRPRLAPRAIKRRAVHELLAPNQRATASAWLVLATVRVERAVEVPRFTVDVDVQRIERGPAVGQRVAHHLRGGLQHRRQL